MIVPSSARPPRRAPSAWASTSSTTASGTKREKRSRTWRRSASAFSRARATVSSASATWSASVSSAARSSRATPSDGLDLERAAPLAHHDEREAARARRVPGCRRPWRPCSSSSASEARGSAARERDRGLDRGAVDLLVGRRRDERRRRGAQLRLAGERALVAARRCRRAARRRAATSTAVQATPIRSGWNASTAGAASAAAARNARRAGVSFGAVSGTGSDGSPHRRVQRRGAEEEVGEDPAGVDRAAGAVVAADREHRVQRVGDEQADERERRSARTRPSAPPVPNSSRAATASRSTSPSGYAIETSFSASESESSRV